MDLLKSTLSSKGQVTIPQDIRTLMGLESGDAVIFTCEKGHVEIQKASSDFSIYSLAGSLDGKGKQGASLTIDDMDAAILKGASVGISE